AGCTMLSSGLPPVFLLLTALEMSWSLSDEEKKIILDGHNKYRSQVSPPAMDMLKMSWDTELESFAQAYAEKCIWDHNKERGRRGENLFAMAPTLDLEFAVEDWNGEEKYYNLTTSACVPGQMCGHYTQVVWASTHQIGCGAKFCEKIDGIDTEGMYLLVCNYYPPGNMKGRKPYKEGPSCSQCPEGRVCVNSLCGNFSFAQIFPSNSMFSSLLPAGALDTEELETNSDQTSMDQPTAGAPSTCLGLSLFLLPSVILVGLLL
ncbi:PI16 inhibitor, partial [Ibidorhyncha struthersii]|nr:PI16 inhibitor [Ibidorhyncha struthersii]